MTAPTNTAVPGSKPGAAAPAQDGSAGATGPSIPDVGDLLDRAVTALGGRRRTGQDAMARAVADAIDSHEHLLVQAGTGTGKSLAYLVPAVRHAVLAQERVVVSTATLALQRQVMTRDLPLVASAVAPQLPRAPVIALLKGWHNYLCAHKLAGGYPQDEPGTLFDALGEAPGAADHPAPEGAGVRTEGATGLGQQVLRLREWAEQTTTGDRDDCVPGVQDRAWRQVSVTKMECLGTTCPMLADCFPERARARAREADVVVTNHAMLGIAAGGSPGILPEHEVLVVDEAHELTERVTAQATVELSVATVEHAARLARRHGGVPTTELDAASQLLGSVLAELPEGRLRGGVPATTTFAVAAVRDAARHLLTALKPDGPKGPAAAEGGLKMAASAVLAVFEIGERMTGDAASDGRDVLWCARGEQGWGRSGASRLHAAPLAVSGLVRTHLLTGRTAVLTSATLALGGSFTPLARALGLDPAQEVRGAAAVPGPALPPVTAAVTGPVTAAETRPPLAHASDPAAPAAPDLVTHPVTAAPTHPARHPSPVAGTGPREVAGPGAPAVPAAGADLSAGPSRWRGIDVGSPFDYPRAGILYIARHLPAPGREPTTDAQLDEIAGLITAAGGATLGLFSSRRAALAAAEAMRERLEVPVLCQGDDQLPTLIQQFAADEATCLFGTLSLWQGLDVPGPTCRLVLIDRIPFPRPDDPVRSARTEAVEAAGGNGFMTVSAAHAALLLAQGSGRLVRTDTDRGVVAVLDPRLATARYGTFLVRTMPPFWPTTDPAVARSALVRLARVAAPTEA